MTLLSVRPERIKIGKLPITVFVGRESLKVAVLSRINVSVILLYEYITKENGLGVCRTYPGFPGNGSQILSSPYKKGNNVTMLGC